jgi:hypothetical protein
MTELACWPMIVAADCDRLCEFGKINEKSMMWRLRNSAPRTIDRTLWQITRHQRI